MFFNFFGKRMTLILFLILYTVNFDFKMYGNVFTVKKKKLIAFLQYE